MPQWYLDWLIAKFVPRALRGAWEVGIDPLEEGYKPFTVHEEYGVGTVGRWALRWPAPLPTCDDLAPADYAIYFWYIIDGDHRIIKWEVLGETVFCHMLAPDVSYAHSSIGDHSQTPSLWELPEA